MKNLDGFRKWFDALGDTARMMMPLDQGEVREKLQRAKPSAGAGDAGKFPYDVKAWDDSIAQSHVEGRSRC